MDLSHARDPERRRWHDSDFLDDEEVRDVELPKRTVQPKPTHLFYGNQVFPTGNVDDPFDVWFDELLLDDQPVRCAD